MRRLGMVLLLLSLCLLFAACGSEPSSDGESAAANENNKNNEEKLTVVTTIFPVYDFVREVGGEYVSVTKLLPSGAESHSFEPTPSDIIAINDADLFLYTGEIMEPWAATVIEGIDSDSLVTGDVSLDVPLLRHEDSADEGGDHYDYDPHIWTDPTRAMIMVDHIAEYLSHCDVSHADEYRANAEAYKKDLSALDQKIQEIVATGKRDKIIFGGRFAFLYFVDRYGLEFDAAVDSCSEHSEPSAKKIAEIISEIEDEEIPVVYYEELTTPTVAQSISDDTGAKTLLFHSCHNVTEEELEDGVSYLSLMRQNADNLREGLN